jgi:molybdate transport system substrate-binding protein
MKNTKKMISALLILVILFSLFSVNVYAKTTKKVTLTISVAASLTDAITEISEQYKKEKPYVTLEFNFGSSGALQKQIEQGASVDVFLSAATKQMDALKSESLLIDDTIKTLLYNELVLIVPKDSKSSITGFRSLSRKSVKTIALGEPTSVPAGQYAEQVLTYYGNLEAVQKKAVYGKDVTEVLTWVEGGNADAGIVYKTDALNSDKVTIISTAPDESHKTIEYPGAVIKDSKNSKEAKAFLTYLSGSKATMIFKKYGFIIE